MQPSKGIFAALLAELRADVEAHERERASLVDEEQQVRREPPREERRPVARSRSERMQSLKGRRERALRLPSDFLSLEDVSPREESLETRCVRPSLRFQAHVELVVTRPLPPADARALEVHEQEPGEPGSVGALERASREIELERVRVLKPAGVLAHLRALDLALSSGP